MVTKEKKLKEEKDFLQQLLDGSRPYKNRSLTGAELKEQSEMIPFHLVSLRGQQMITGSFQIILTGIQSLGYFCATREVLEAYTLAMGYAIEDTVFDQ